MKQLSNENRNWYLVDLKDEVLGRVSTKIANLLQGKNKIEFARNLDNGDYIVAINASKITISGDKANQKLYRKHTGYIGNLKEVSYLELLKKNPQKIIQNSVHGMLPKNKLRDGMMLRLKVYANDSHPHQNVKFTESVK